jgi:hypothetical protein
MNPIHALTSCFSKSYFNTIFQPTPKSSTQSVSFKFSYCSPVCISLLPDIQWMSRSARPGVTFRSMLSLTATTYWTFTYTPPKIEPIVTLHDYLFSIHLPYLVAVYYILSLRTRRCKVTGTHLPRTTECSNWYFKKWTALIRIKFYCLDIFTHGSRLTHVNSKSRFTA